MTQKQDQKLRDEFYRFQKEYQEVLMPYFEALEVDGKEAFNRYAALRTNKDASVPKALKVMGKTLGIVGFMSGIEFINAASQNHMMRDYNHHLTYKQRLKMEYTLYDNPPRYAAQDIILERAFAYKESSGRKVYSF